MSDSDVASVIAKESRVELRQRLPLKMTAVVERCFGDNRYSVSSTESTIDLKLFCQEIREICSRAKQNEMLIEGTKENMEVGDFWFVCRKNDANYYRAQIVQVGETNASCRLLDFGFSVITFFSYFYRFSDPFEVFYPQYANLPPFITRVNLLDDEVLRSLGLPTSEMIKQGDIVDVTIMTTVEPHVAVFGLARSNIHRPLPDNLLDGFNEKEVQNWLSFFDDDCDKGKNTELFSGKFGKLQHREFHSNRLVFIGYVRSLDKIYVHDLESMIRLPLIRQQLDILYGDEKLRQQYTVTEMLSVGMGCVAYHESAKSYVRCEVISVGTTRLEVTPVDQPNLGNFIVNKDQVFKATKSLDFPRQSFMIRATRSLDSTTRQILSSLARCILPPGTPVVLSSESKLGLCKITSAAAPKGILSKIGFVKMGQSKFKTDEMIQSNSFKKNIEKKAPKIDSIMEFAGRLSRVSKPLKPAVMH